MNKIALVIPWYGNIPTYFNYYLKGLTFNESVLDILFFTESEIPSFYDLPSNFKVIHFPWTSLQERMKEKIGEEAKVGSPYKLCDYKPMYGKMFEEELKPYEFWGYGDIDLIYGDLKRYLPHDGIDNYDAITFRENLIHGPFSVFRNNEFMRNLYTKSNKLDYVFNSESYIGFDEAGRAKKWRAGERLYNLLDIDGFVDWTCIVQEEADKNGLRLFERYYCLESLYSDSILTYQDGKLKLNYGLEEYAFFHFVYHKKTQMFFLPFMKKLPDVLYFHYTGCYFELGLSFKIKKKVRKIKGFLRGLRKRLIDSYNYRIKKS